MSFIPDELATKRAEKEKNCKLWSPRDALIATLQDIDSGKIAPTTMAIHYWTETDEGYDVGYCAAKLSFPEHVALLNAALRSVMNRWLNS